MNPNRTPHQPPAAPATILVRYNKAHTLWTNGAKRWAPGFGLSTAISEPGQSVRYYLRGTRLMFISYAHCDNVTVVPKILPIWQDGPSGGDRNYYPNAHHEADACIVV